MGIAEALKEARTMRKAKRWRRLGGMYIEGEY